MANIDRTPSSPTVQPAGVEGEGLDPYPTYRDGPITPHAATVEKPTDVGLPRSRRTSGLPMLLGLAAIALVFIVMYVLWGGMNLVRSTDEAAVPGGPASPPASTATAPATDSPAATGSLGQGEAPAASGPGTVEPTPGPIDVPGGETTTPATTTPQ